MSVREEAGVESLGDGDVSIELVQLGIYLSPNGQLTTTTSHDNKLKSTPPPTPGTYPATPKPRRIDQHSYTDKAAFYWRIEDDEWLHRDGLNLGGCV